ncbi:MAG: TIGR00282 family metallophosphoesterase [Oscillospiraceae bacterium]
MKILCVGDVVGRIGREYLIKNLSQIKKENKIDAVIVNGENSCSANGVSVNSANDIFTSGADCITTGNHTFKRKEIYQYLEENHNIIRPYNWGGVAPGKGFCVIDLGRIKIGVVNLIGTVYMEWAKSPFEYLDLAVEYLKKQEHCKIIIVDFHAEATSEKGALAYYADGKVSAIFGTHTHVQTADEQILPNGTAFITDLGMTGPICSILGVKPEIIVEKYKTAMPQRFENGEGQCVLCGAIITIDETSGKAQNIERIRI